MRWMRLFLTQHIATSSVLLCNPPSPKGKVRREINPRPTYHLRLGEDFTAKRFHMIYHISLIEDEFHCGASRHLPRPTIINGNCYRNLRVTRRTTNGRPYDITFAATASFIIHHSLFIIHYSSLWHTAPLLAPTMPPSFALFCYFLQTIVCIFRFILIYSLFAFYAEALSSIAFHPQERAQAKERLRPLRGGCRGVLSPHPQGARALSPRHK